MNVIPKETAEKLTGLTENQIQSKIQLSQVASHVYKMKGDFEHKKRIGEKINWLFEEIKTYLK